MKRGLVCLSAAVLGLMTVQANAATLLYQWNFDDNGGTGSSVTPNATPNGLSTDGGTLTMAQLGGTSTYTPANLYTASGGGETGVAGDYAFDNSTSVSNNPNPGGVAYTTAASLLSAMPNVTQYTMTMWVKPTTAELAVQSRLFEIMNTANADENNTGVWIGLNAGKIQTGGSSSNQSFIIGNTLVANTWNFVAVEVDLTAGNVYFDPAMQAAISQNDSLELYQGDQTSGVYGVTAGNGFANGTTSFAAQGDYVQLLNRTSNANRAFQGQGDDFRIYSGLLTSSQLQALTTPASVPEPASLGLLAITACGLLSRRRRTYEEMGAN